MPKALSDFRKMLDDRSVDAVVAATPDHWHALAAVWACQAGKDVYVEKPASHSCWEGRQMVEAARKHQRIVQVGLQNRSAAYNAAAKEYLASGKLGKIHFCRIYNQKEWGNTPWAKDCDPPAGLDWDMWNGAAPQAAYNPTLHTNWHHLWRYSGGDIANDASHQIDLARWLLGVDYPKTVYSTGGRFNSRGSCETPDTQVAVYDFDNLVVSFELTLYTPYMLKISPQIRASKDRHPYWPQCATRIEIYGDKGLMYVGRHGGGWQVFGRPKDEKPVLVAEGKGLFPDPEHKENFVQCIRSRQLPNADIEKGHRTRPVDALREHQLPPGRPEADDRPEDRAHRRRRRGDEALQARVPQAVGDRGAGVAACPRRTIPPCLSPGDHAPVFSSQRRTVARRRYDHPTA